MSEVSTRVAEVGGPRSAQPRVKVSGNAHRGWTTRARRSIKATGPLRPMVGPFRTTPTSPPRGRWFAPPRSDDRRDRGCSNGSRTGAASVASGIGRPGRSIRRTRPRCWLRLVGAESHPQPGEVRFGTGCLRNNVGSRAMEWGMAPDRARFSPDQGGLADRPRPIVGPEHLEAFVGRSGFPLAHSRSAHRFRLASSRSTVAPASARAT